MTVTFTSAACTVPAVSRNWVVELRAFGLPEGA